MSLIKADIPGVKKKDINIRIDGNVVQIDAEGNGGNILRSKRLQLDSQSKEKPSVPPRQKSSLSPRYQCAISTGKVIDRNTVREVPPNTHSRARL